MKAPAAADALPHQDGFVVLYVGRRSPEKNLEFLIRVFHSLSVRNPSVSLWLAGDGPSAEPLKALAASLGIANKEHLPHAQLAAVYRRADVFVLPSFFETLGMVCVEAMRFGKPLLVSDGIVSCRELVDEGRNGFVFQHTREASLLERLDLLAHQPDLRAVMAANSALKASSFSLDGVIAAHENLYRSLVS